jgi:hypothetical protein
MLLEKVDLRSPIDVRSGRPVHRPEAEVVAIASAIRALADATATLDRGDPAAARTYIDRVRGMLVPLVLQQAER